MRLSGKTFTGLWVLIIALGTSGCAHFEPRLYAPPQRDGWSAQPIPILRRFTPDARLDPVTRTPVGDEGYYFYVLTRVGAWDYRSTKSFLWSHWRQPWGHSWLLLESPTNRFECGLNGNFGRMKPKYEEGVRQKWKSGDLNPVSYLWETMPDGEIEVGNGDRAPTFVWRMPITQEQHQRIHEHVMHWKYDQIGVQSNNCIDLVTEAAELAGINLIHRIRLTFPAEIKTLWKRLRVWTDPRYGALECSTPDILEVDLRHLARFGIGRDVTDWYRASDRANGKRDPGAED